MLTINIDQFINKHITKREISLFARDIHQNEQELFSRITGKSLLVIGGAGTIGSYFIKAALNYSPGRLYIIDINENALTELTRDLRSSANIKVPEAYKTYPVNFNDTVFYKILENEGPFEIIANFAAHKHVRSEKDQYSIQALLENNIINAEKLLQCLINHPPEHFFCVSTDKAANPVNIMGASKKVMEEVLMSYCQDIPVTTARFANVAFSNGSLLYGFYERITKRQPISSPMDVKRYFVSPEESGQICLLACMLGSTGDIFFPKLAEEHMMTFSHISDLFLRELDLEPIICHSEQEAKEMALHLDSIYPKYPVYYFSSDTAGEKLFEEFFTEDEKVDLLNYNSLGVIKNATRKSRNEVNEMIRKLKQVLGMKELSKSDIVTVLTEFLPGFHHIETGKNLDQRM